MFELCTYSGFFFNKSIDGLKNHTAILLASPAQITHRLPHYNVWQQGVPVTAECGVECRGV